MDSGWWHRVYGFEYVGICRGRLVFVRPEGRLGEGDLEYESREILRVYGDWCMKSGVACEVEGVRWVSLGEVGLVHDEILRTYGKKVESQGLRHTLPNASTANASKGVASQPEPVKVEGRGYIFERVIEDMRARADMGLKKYGTYLQACNGRDGLRDAYEEVLDLAVYLRQVIDERDERMAGVGELMKKLGV